jgi:hypothetical protein
MRIGAKAKVIDWRSVYSREVVELNRLLTGKAVIINDK